MTMPGRGRAIVAGVGAVIAVGVGYHFGGDLRGKHATTQHRVIAYSAAAVFIVLGSATTRRIANDLGRAVAQADRASASVIRLVLTIVGIIVVVFVTLAMLHIDVSQLLLGGAITGIVVGIAAQQSLGNMFAGIVLMLARPFRAGDHIRVRTGMLGGAFEGDVVSMGLTYVTFSTEEGTTLVPNLTMLASGIVRSPRPLPDAAVAGQQPGLGAPPAPAIQQPGPAPAGQQPGLGAPPAPAGQQPGPPAATQQPGPDGPGAPAGPSA